MNRKFERSAIGGYRNDDVDNYLNEVAQNYGELDEQNKVLSKKLEVLAEKLEEYRNDEESLRSALLSAQKLGDSVIRESKTKAEIIMRDANVKAERMERNAAEKMEKEKMVYLKLQKDVAAFKNRLIATYKQHLELISSLPDDPDKDKEPEREPAPAPAAPTAEQMGEEQPRMQPMERPKEPQRDEPEQHQARAQAQGSDAYEEPYEEHAPTPRKFIPVPHRENYDLEENAHDREAKKSPYADEYYEDFSEETINTEDNSVNKRPSKFGTLKFGAGYDLKRE